jgi:hypothetical protein
MADTVASLLLENGNRNWGYQLTSFSDGTGETAVVKVDGSASGPLGVTIAGQTFYPGVHLKIKEIRFQVTDMSVRLQWDAGTPRDIVTLSPGADTLKFEKFGGIFIPVGLAGATGKILLTTIGQQVNSSYMIAFWGTKGIHQ